MQALLRAERDQYSSDGIFYSIQLRGIITWLLHGKWLHTQAALEDQYKTWSTSAHHVCTYACKHWNFYVRELTHFPSQRYTKCPIFLELYICRAPTSLVLPYWTQLARLIFCHPSSVFMGYSCVRWNLNQIKCSQRTHDDTNPEKFVWMQWWPHASKPQRNLPKAPMTD